ncbi:M20/M25/M40 family metallo-hydrolase [Acidaminobacter sp. JC074]|uniref:M20 family metallopeptidase n=1 Tax=Acidaminobacter sp. JC074 TaxID=2530199 RepID=UPI001F10D666|nr:M20/M25/M40 family metallo-hydrolase [Acidaminobacter sp. JC074]MCH4889026.1 M20/M25/M40 family metallo-hydrolase [Acidaminobacter sp. JC074]
MNSLELLKKLVKMDTSTVDKANECIEFCQVYLKFFDIDSEIIVSNQKKSLVATVGSGDKCIVLNGHIDVVSADSSQFEPYVEDNLFYGRGASDMKAGVVAIIHAFIKMKDASNVKVMLQLVSDEEVGGHNGTKVLVEKGYTGDFVICTEPTQMAISTRAKGILQVDMITYGKAAHGSRPWLGENAIEKAYENFKKIKSLPILKIGDDIFENSSVNLSISQGGDIYNRVPDYHKMGIDIRYVPHLDPEEILNDIRNVIEGDVQVVQMEPGILVSTDNFYIDRIKEAFKRAHYEDVKIFGQHGSSDVRFFSTLNIPAIEVGPKGGNWHGKDEYVDLETLELLENLLVDFLMNL